MKVYREAQWILLARPAGEVHGPFRLAVYAAVAAGQCSFVCPRHIRFYWH